MKIDDTSRSVMPSFEESAAVAVILPAGVGFRFYTFTVMKCSKYCSYLFDPESTFEVAGAGLF